MKAFHSLILIFFLLPLSAWSDTVEELVVRMHSPDPTVRLRAVRALAAKGREAGKAVPALLELIQNDDSNTFSLPDFKRDVFRARLKAIKIIGDLGREIAAPAIATLYEIYLSAPYKIKTEEQEIFEEALGYTLDKIGKPSLDLLCKNLKTPTKAKHRDVVMMDLLDYMDDARAQRAFVEQAKELSPAVRSLAAQRMAENGLTDLSLFPAIMSLLNSDDLLPGARRNDSGDMTLLALAQAVVKTDPKYPGLSEALHKQLSFYLKHGESDQEAAETTGLIAIIDGQSPATPVNIPNQIQTEWAALKGLWEGGEGTAVSPQLFAKALLRAKRSERIKVLREVAELAPESFFRGLTQLLAKSQTPNILFDLRSIPLCARYVNEMRRNKTDSE